MTHGFSLLSSTLQKAVENRFARFLAVGLLNTAFGYAVYVAGLTLGATPSAALATATITGALFNYFSTGHIVFDHRSLKRLPLFAAVYVLTFAVNAGALAGLIRLGWGPALSQLALLPFMAVLSFALFRAFVFKDGRQT